MKGVEGLALRYVLIILVAALVIGTVFTVVQTFTGMAASTGLSLVETTSTGFDQMSETACESFGTNCQWTDVNGTNTCVCS